MIATTVGCDPEMFLVDYNNQFVSSIGKIGGSKKAPKALGRKGFFVQEDNVAVEFNIPPAKSSKQFVQSVNWSIRTITKNVEKLGLKPKIQAAALFPARELLNPKAMVFGCEPDFNAWNAGRINGRPISQDAALRSCGGHVHVGIQHKTDDKDKEELIWSMIKAMDFYLGVPSVLLDDDTTRRELYGTAGAFRYQTHSPIAFEYRVLSNFWLQSPSMMKWIYNQTLHAVNHVWEMGHKKFDEFLKKEELGYNIQKAINNSDVGLANTLVADYKLVTP